MVYVVGEVGRPSGFMMDGGHLTVLQAIALGRRHDASRQAEWDADPSQRPDGDH